MSLICNLIVIFVHFLNFGNWLHNNYCKDFDSKRSHNAWYEYRLRFIELILERYHVGKGKL